MENVSHVYSKDEILEAWQKAVDEVSEYSKSIDSEHFTKNINEKWSVSENLDHLIRSTKPIVKALGAPKLALRMFGKPNGPSKTLSQIYNDYLAELQQGATAMGPFLPDSDLNQNEMIDFWNSVGQRFGERLAKWKESDLDKYVLKHPVLGKMTVREMLFFTLFHTYHHLNAMKKNDSMML